MSPSPQKKHRYPFKTKLKRKGQRIVFMLLAAAVVTCVNYYHKHYGSNTDSLAQTASTQKFSPKSTSKEFSESQQKQAIQKIKAAKNNSNAQFWVGLNGKVVKLLKDDLKGSRHQKFLISPSSGITLLVAHNIDLASRIHLNKGDLISLYGRYEWNNRGGVIHWTHHDPKGKRKGGWIQTNGKTYR